jgi:hypothetical protein
MIFVVPHGAPEGYEWLAALVTIVCLYFAVRNFMRSGEAKPLDGRRRKRPDLPNLNPVRPGPGPEERLRELQRRFRKVEASKRPSDFSRLCESMKDAPPKEQAGRVREHFGIFGGARPAEGQGRKGKRSP